MEIFEYEFMIRAFTAGGFIAVAAPLIGIFMVVRRYSLLTDTLAHVSLVGVAFAIMAGINAIIGSLVISLLAGLGMEKLRKERGVFSESVLAVFLTGSLAISLILLSLAEGVNFNLMSYLFGSITTISTFELTTIISVSIVVTAIIVLLFKKFFLISYNEELAEVSGLRVKFLNYLLISLAAFTISVSIKAIGVLLIGALMIIPVITAMQMGKGFKLTAIISIIISSISTFSGIYLSYYLDLPSGAMVVVVLICVFLLSIISKKIK